MVLGAVVLWIGVGAVVFDDGPSPTPEYAFLETTETGDPVAYRCLPLGYVVRPRGAPDGWEQTVSEAVAAVEEASGYDLVERTATDGDPGSEDPVITIRWADQGSEPALGGRVLGIGGSATVSPDGAAPYYTSGEIVLDRAGVGAFDDEGQRVTLMHEFGHVLGLDHVASVNEVMSTGVRRATDNFGPGDRLGLMRLHAVSCGS